MWREEYFLEGFRFIGTEEFNTLKEKVGKGWRKPWEHLTEEEWDNYYLYKFRQESCGIEWDGELRDDDDHADSLGALLIIQVELERRINLILGRATKTIEESIIDNKIGEVALLNAEQYFKLGKLIRPTRLDISAQILYRKMQEKDYFETKTIVYGNTNLYNIAPVQKRLGFLLEYHKSVERRIKLIRNSKEYQWLLNKDGVMIGTWGKF